MRNMSKVFCSEDLNDYAVQLLRCVEQGDIEGFNEILPKYNNRVSELIQEQIFLNTNKNTYRDVSKVFNYPEIIDYNDWMKECIEQTNVQGVADLTGFAELFTKYNLALSELIQVELIEIKN